MKNENKLKRNQEINDPCYKERELSYKCFHKNDFDKSKCEMAMNNYKACKAFWNEVKSDRLRRGIKPSLPPVDERDQVKNEYLKRFM